MFFSDFSYNKQHSNHPCHVTSQACPGASCNHSLESVSPCAHVVCVTAWACSVWRQLCFEHLCFSQIRKDSRSWPPKWSHADVESLRLDWVTESPTLGPEPIKEAWGDTGVSSTHVKTQERHCDRTDWGNVFMICGCTKKHTATPLNGNVNWLLKKERKTGCRKPSKAADLKTRKMAEGKDTKAWWLRASSPGSCTNHQHTHCFKIQKQLEGGK